MKYFLILLFGLFTTIMASAQAYNNVVVLTPAKTSPWVMPTDFNNSDNRIECIGRGGVGSARKSNSLGGNGGGGGSYCSAGGGYHGTGGVNLGIPGSTVDFQIGTKIVNAATWIKYTAASGGAKVEEAFGGSDATTSAPGNGGVSVPLNGFTKTYPGGDGGVPTTTAGAGGGGAAGPKGEGVIGSPNVTGGSADNFTLRGQSSPGQPGYNGSEWVSLLDVIGCGSGGAGGFGGTAPNGGAGGIFGGGGGGADAGSAVNAGGGGSDGLIVISYNSTFLTPTPTPTASPSTTPANKNKMLFRKSQP